EDLCGHLLGSLAFDFDHMYEFVIGGRGYEGEPPYGPSRGRCRTKLYSLGLKKGDMFTLLYDYGDCWKFLITVMDVEDKPGQPSQLISSKGDVDQYPYEEDDDWDPDEDEDWDPEEDGGDADEDDELPEEDDWDPDEDDWFLDMDEFVKAPGGARRGTHRPAGELIMPAWGHTASDSLFDLAFRYKKSKFWKKLSDDEIFALRLKDGSTGYVCVMGQAGEHCSVALFPDDAALDLLRRYVLSQPIGRVVREDGLYQMDNIQLIFDNKEFLNEKELLAVRAYAERNDLRLAGKNAFPHIVRYRPERVPWSVDGPADEDRLAEAIRACLDLSENLGKKRPREAGFTYITPESDTLPLVTYDETTRRYRISGTAGLKPLAPVTYPGSGDFDRILAANVKKHRRKCTLQCKVVLITEPVVSEDDPVPFFPKALFTFNESERMAILPDATKDYEEHPEKQINQLLKQLDLNKVRPARIKAADERTYALLKEAAEALGAKLTMEEQLPELEDLIGGLVGFGGDDETSLEDEYAMMLEMLEEIPHMPDHMIATMPGDLREIIRDMIEAGLVPD
ncbi:MAG: hypothetical protein IJV04_10145, partial [Lachnospiraceae bacterium]|nr:hypothetical protein [Lachnospiraceae bacterium]